MDMGQQFMRAMTPFTPCPNPAKSGDRGLNIPTPPNPTTGTIVIVPQDEVIEPGWSIEDSIRTVISAGIIGPEEVSIRAPV